MSKIKPALAAFGFLFVLFVFAPATSYGQDDSSTLAEQSLRQIETEISSAYLKGDMAILDRIWADEYTLTPPNGMVISKAAYLAMLKSGAVKYDYFKPEKIEVRVYDNAAVVTGVVTVRGSVPGHTINGQDRFLTVYVKRQGRWQAVATQVARVAQLSAQGR